MRLLGDPLRLGQILINCVTNAVKFTAQGEVCVKVRLASTEAQHCLVVFEVVDTGIGLSEPQMARLFQSFEQADDSTTRQFGGTGLGLSICKGLACPVDGWQCEGGPPTGPQFQDRKSVV